MLPVVAGIRRGVAKARVAIAEEGDATLVTAIIEEENLQANRAAVSVLVLGALAGLSLIVAPLFPSLWPLVPFGLIGAFGSWFLVISRLAHAEVPQFLEQLEAEVLAETEPER